MNSYNDIYKAYINCLNKRDLMNLRKFVHDNVSYNNNQIGLPGYQKMLEQNFNEIPDLHFDIELLISSDFYVASRLRFDCTPQSDFLGLPINGKKVSFTENVFYQFKDEKIEQVWSVIDKMAIEKQL